MFERRIHVSLDTLDHVERRHGPHGHRHHVKNYINWSIMYYVYKYVHKYVYKYV